MVELFNTELDLPSILPPGTKIDLKTARNAMNAIYTRPENERWKTYLGSSLRSLHYQNLTHNEDANTHLEAGGMMYNGGDFLHFGTNIKYPESPDTLPSLSRIYVTTKPWAIGHIAAEVIRRAREKGYEPYGKVWDESSSPKPLHDRQDRILFYPTTKTHQDIILEALREVHTQEPDSFETQPPILVEKTDIPGVGIADDPAKDEAGERQSFTQSRVTILGEAVKLALDKIYGSSNETAVSKGRIIDKRIITLRDELQNGTKTKEHAFTMLRQAVAEVSLKHGVSPENFARNTNATPPPTESGKTSLPTPEQYEALTVGDRFQTENGNIGRITSAITNSAGKKVFQYEITEGPMKGQRAMSMGVDALRDKNAIILEREAPALTREMTSPEALSSVNLIEKINTKLTTEAGDTTQTELPPQVFAKYLETVPLPEGAKIGGLSIVIDGDKIKAVGEVQKTGTSRFSAEFTIGPDGKLIMTNRDVKFALLIRRDSDRKKLTDGLDNVATTLTDYLNTQINPVWKVGGYAITGNNIGIKFTKST